MAPALVLQLGRLDWVRSLPIASSMQQKLAELKEVFR
jgi:hypothetical protein